MSMPIAPALQVRVLGPLEAWVDGRPLQADTRKAVAILALLGVERRAFARDELAAMLWPDADDEAARGSLRRTLSTLRSGLGNRWIDVDRTRVALDPGDVWLDLAEVERAIEADEMPALEAAARLVRGPFLAGFNLRDSPAFDDWRAARASSVERTLANLLDRLATLQAERGDIAAAVGTAMRRLELDPLDEPAQRRVIALLAEAGDRGGAIRQYRTCAALLDRELGVAPLAETVALYEAIRDGSYAPPERPVPLDASRAAETPSLPAARPALPPLPFVGRDAELDAVRVQHGASGRDGQVVAIEGEPGIGKTRLLQEIADEVTERGGRVLVARAWASESGIAYAPIVELLRRSLEQPAAVERLAALPDGVRAELGRLVALPPALIPATGTGTGHEGLDPSLARGRLLDSLAATLLALVAGPVAGIVAVDDLHHADASTLELVGWLLRRLEGRPVLVVLTWCAEELGEHALPVAALAETLPGGLVLRLRRLDRPAVARLVEGLRPHDAGRATGNQIDAYFEASEGLPIDLAERLAGGAGEAADARGDGHASPHGFRALLRERLARVGETASQVLAAGAVIGRSFDLPTVRAASGRSEEETVAALEELIRRGLLRESASGPELRFDFVHGSLRETAYAGISLVRRRLLHGRVADTLRGSLDREGSGGLGELGRLVRIAQHERDAGRTAEAAEAFRAAAEGARRVYANREAIELLESAIALGHPATPGLQRLLGDLRLGLGEYVLAIAAFEAAAASAAGAYLAELELLLARAHARRGDFATADSHIDAGLLAARAATETEPAPGPDVAGPQVAVRLLIERGVVALQAQRPEVAQDAAAAALEAASRLADRTSEGRAQRILGLVARSRGDLPAARLALERSLQLAATDPDPGAAIAASNALALVEAAAGDHAAAIAHLESAAAEARRIGERHLEAAIENNLADSFHATGDTDRSMDHLRRAVALFAEIGGRPTELEPAIWKLQSW